jgi:hypothetical protein
MKRKRAIMLSAWLVAVSATGILAAHGQPVTVHDSQTLRDALAQARPGHRIVIKPGDYTGGITAANLHGTADQPIVITGSDPQHPPVIKGGNEGLHLVNPQHVEVRDIVLTGARHNGINIDDGGNMQATAHHVTLRNVRVHDLDPDGNHDAVKLSGVRDFLVTGCVFERWGASSGSGVDMVGCRQGRIELSVFRHLPKTATAANTGIQAKGGTRDILIRRCRFEHAGGRSINIGGNTGLQFFRPPLDTWDGPRWEARDIAVEGNIFIGSGAPVAFVGVDGAVVRFNTLYHPGKWALRILQETTAPGFVPSRNGVFTDNIVVFRSDQWGQGGCNIGPNTASDTFRFARNVWYCADAPGKSPPRLPTNETGGVYGVDPQLTAPEQGDFRPRPGSPAIKAGATALDPDISQ